MRTCPGCGLELPGDAVDLPPRVGYLATPECHALMGEIVAYEAANPAQLLRWHQLTVDAYGAQHTGPRTRTITTAFALNGLYLVLERGFSGTHAREAHGYLAETVPEWPRFAPPSGPPAYAVTVLDVALAGSPEEHRDLLMRWGGCAWDAWRHVHAEVAEMTDRQLRGWRPASA